MRLIDADALDREMYRKSFEVDDGRNVWNSGLWIRYKIFEEAIRDAPTVDAFGCWIPVTDRLPDATGLYLVSCYQVYDYVTISTFELYEDGSYWTEIGVEAWMPIPDPYKGEKK